MRKAQRIFELSQWFIQNNDKIYIKRLPIPRLLIVGILFINLFGLPASVQAQGPNYTTNPDCPNPPNCNSGDFEIISIFLASNDSGTPLTSAACDSGGPISTFLCVTFENTTNSDRNGIYLFGDLMSGVSTSSLEHCFDGFFAGMTQSTFCIPSPETFDWDCSSSITLDNTFIAWGSASGDVCPGGVLDCGPTTPSKCRSLDPMMVNTPLVVNFNFECNPTGLGVAFTDATVGGSLIYSSYSWDFGDMTGISTDSNPIYDFGVNTGSFNVELTVIDSDNNMDDIVITVDLGALGCCPDDLIANCPLDETHPACTDQNAVDSGFTAWLNQFSFSNGQNPSGTDLSGLTAPNYCGGLEFVQFIVTDDCSIPNADDTCSATFTITDAPLVDLTCPGDTTVMSCQTQGEVDAEFSIWLGRVSSIGGCNMNLTDDNTGSPDICGGSTTVEWTATSDCEADVTCRATFTVTDAPLVDLTCPGDTTVMSCQTQGEVDAEFSIWLGRVNSIGGCNMNLTDDNTGSPDICGGSTTVEWTATSDCESDVTCSATFTVTDAPLVDLTCPGDTTVMSCQTQGEVDAEFSIWLGRVSSIGGCNMNLTDDDTGSPDICGGSTTVEWTATSDCESDVTCSATFTVTDAPLVDLTCPGDTTVMSCQTQGEVDAEFSIWLGRVSSIGGCNMNLTDDNTGSPDICGGSTTVEWTATSDCEADVTCSATFTVTDAPLVDLTCPGDTTVMSCQTQGEVDAEFSIWLGRVSSTGGCNMNLTDDNTGSPDICGGSTTVEWTATSDCEADVTCMATFTVTDAPLVDLTCPGDTTVMSCQTQGEVDAEFLIWLGRVSSIGGCNMNLTDDNTGSPDICGGSTTVEWTATSDCEADVTCRATFTVTDAPLIDLTCPGDTTVMSCQTQGEVDAEFLIWLGRVSSIGGCNMNLTDDNTGSPDICGGSTTVEWTATSDCEADVTCSATFTVTDAPLVDLTCPGDTTVMPCQTQGEVDAEFSIWLGRVNSIGGCNMNLTDDNTGSPDICGGSTTVEWTATSDCESDVTCSATFTVTDAPLVDLTCPGDTTVMSCQTQGEVDAEFSIWLGRVSSIGGCNMNLTDDNTGSPDICGGSTTVEWTATSDCESDVTCSATFTVTDAPLVDLTCPGDTTVMSCQTQGEVDAEFSIWLGRVSSIGGCNMNLTDDNTGSPDICGGSTTVEWTATSDCESDVTCSATFTVTDAPLVDLTCPGDTTVMSCQTQGEVDAEFSIWLGRVSSIGGCNMNLTDDDTGSPDICGGSTTVEWTATSDCESDVTCSATFTVTDAPLVDLTCPGDTTVMSCQTQGEVDAEFSIWLGRVSSIGGCNMNLTDDDTGSPDICGGSTTVEWTATSDCESDVTCSATFTVTDHFPVFPQECPVDSSINCDAVIPLEIPMYIDECDSIQITMRDDINGFDGSCTNNVLGYIIRTFFAEDRCGNIDSSCVVTYTVIDTTPPVILFVGELIDGLNSGDIVEYQCYGQDMEWGLPPMGISDVIAVDSCDDDVEVTFEDIVEEDGDCATDDGFFRRFRCTWTATDDCGNSSTSFIFFDIVDEIAPQIIGVPSDMSVSCSALPDTSGVSSFDECLCSHLSYREELLDDQACATNETLLRIWTAEDHCGNVTRDTQRLYLIDDVAPEFEAVHPILEGLTDGSILQFDCNEGGFPTWLDDVDESYVQSFDDCSDLGQQSFRRYKSNGRCGNDGYIERILFEWHSEDKCGNESDFLLEAWLTDLSPPVFYNFPDEICTSDPQEIDPIVFDECSSNYALQYEDFVVNQSDCGEDIMRIYTAWDPCLNFSYDTILIHHVDNVRPVITYRNPLMDGGVLRLECQANGETFSGMTLADVTFEDNCTSELTLGFTEEIIDENGCNSEDGYYVVELIWTAEDGCGNITDFKVIAQLYDTQGPVVNLPDTTFYNCGERLPEVEIIDNCGLAESSIHEDIRPGACEGEVVHIYDLVGIDFCGNEMAKKIYMIVEDKHPPIFNDEEYVCTDEYVPITQAYDVCMGRNVDVTLIKEDTVTCEGSSVVTRIYAAVDACGNESTFAQRHYLGGNIPLPAIDISDPWLEAILEQGDVIKIDFSSTSYDRVQNIYGGEIFSPNECLLRRIDFTKEEEVLDNCRADGVREVISFRWRIVGVCGSTDEINLVFEVSDDLAPILNNVPEDVTVHCGILPPVPNLEALDNYPGTLEETFIETPVATPNGWIVTREWSFVDLCGNNLEVRQVVTLVDDPDLSCQIIPTSSIINCNSHNNLFTGVATGSDGPYNYEWRITEGDCLITGGQGTSQISVYVGFMDINLELIVTDVYGCQTVCTYSVDCEEKPATVDFSDQDLNPDESARSIQNEDNSRLIKTWPNPVRDRLSLKVESSVHSSGLVEVYDALGRLMYRQHVKTNQELQLVNDWADGLYFICYTEEDYEQIKHIVKMGLDYRP